MRMLQRERGIAVASRQASKQTKFCTA